MDSPRLRAAWEKLTRDTGLLRGDTAAAAADLDAGVRRLGFRHTGAAGPALLDYAELLTRQPGTRDRGIRMLRWTTIYSAAETGQAFLGLARALEEKGDLEGARAAYGQVIRLWAGADPYRQDAVREARRALERLTAEG